VITRRVLFSLKCTRNRLAAGLRPDTLGKLKRSPRLHIRIKGWGGMPDGREGMRGKGRESEGEGKRKEGK